MHWKHGYYADSGYTYGYYPETMPLRLQWAALIQGHALPQRNFRYLDAGCGQGLNLIIAAASNPDSEFVGIDFLPEHVAHARALAERCGLNNVRFIEGDFVELAKNPDDLGEFDYAVCHGITTWIAPAVKSALFSLIGRVLRPGGVFYNSYNTLPGWLGAMPFQHLVLLEQRSKPGQVALKSAQTWMARLEEHSAGMFAAQPALKARLQQLDKQNPAYLVQEYNNQFWRPVFVTEMMDTLAEVKLAYLGSATLPEAFDNLLPAGLAKLFEEQSSPVIREQLRDYATNQSFRRDLYVKGQRRPWPNEQRQALRNLRVIINPSVERPKKGSAFETRAGSFQLQGDHESYSGVLDAIANSRSGMSIGDLADAFSGKLNFNSVVMTTSLLIHGGWLAAHTMASKAAQTSTTRGNQGLVEACRLGAPYQYALSSVNGGGVPMSDIDWALLDALLQKVPEAKWNGHVKTHLGNLGRALAKDGKAVTAEDDQNKIVNAAINAFKLKKQHLLMP